MDDLPPMRPVSVQPDVQSAPRLWEVPIVLAAVVAAAVVSAYVSAGSALAWTCAVVFLVVGMGLFTASTVRVVRENRGHRLRWWRSAPIRPRRYDLLAALGAPVAGIGTVILARDESIPTWLPLTSAVCVMAVVVGFIYWRHNRGLAGSRPQI